LDFRNVGAALERVGNSVSSIGHFLGPCNVLSMATINFNESTVSMPPDEGALVAELRDRLTEATIKCSERCLYQSAKWWALTQILVFN